MLTDDQIESVWKSKLDAEVRSLYFGELTTRYSRQRQIITGAAFFLSSGAVVTIGAKFPPWLPLLFSIVIAALTAYSIAVNLERRVQTMANLHYSWGQLADEYDLLWNHTYEEDSESRMSELVKKEGELSQLAATDAPNNQKLVGKWQDHVLKRYHLTNE